MRRGPHTSSNPAAVHYTTMKSFVCFLTLAVLLAVASAGYVSSGWSSPYSGWYSRPTYSRISYAPSYGSYGGHSGYGGYGGHGYSGYSGYGGHGGYGGWKGAGWSSGW